MMMAMRCMVVMLACSLVSIAQAATVERRGAEPPIDGQIVRMDDAGIAIRSEAGAEHFVPWDRVRRVQPDGAGVANARLNEHMQRATQLWRARARVERGDAALAEPLFERLFEAYQGQTHETALVVAEGLLRCRLTRGDHVRALIPALETARLKRANQKTVSYSALAPVIDEQTSLCTGLPPVWADGRGLLALEKELAAYKAQGDSIMASIAALYHRAALDHLVNSAALAEDRPSAKPDTEHSGLELLQLLAQTASQDANNREAARNRLIARLEKLPPWAEAWARFAIGCSLLLESGEGRQHAGMVSLAHLPARFGESQPLLAALALQRMIQTLSKTGSPAASTLQAELEREFSQYQTHRGAESPATQSASATTQAAQPSATTQPAGNQTP